jgi:acyl carrier protein
MKIIEAKKIIRKVIQDALEGKIDVQDDMQLIDGDLLLDSMKLVEICLALEDAAEEHGFEFDWTSETTMSKSRSMFRTVESLSEEFSNQAKGQ